MPYPEERGSSKVPTVALGCLSGQPNMWCTHHPTAMNSCISTPCLNLTRPTLYPKIRLKSLSGRCLGHLFAQAPLSEDKYGPIPRRPSNIPIPSLPTRPDSTECRHHRLLSSDISMGPGSCHRATDKQAKEHERSLHSKGIMSRHTKVNHVPSHHKRICRILWR